VTAGNAALPISGLPTAQRGSTVRNLRGAVVARTTQTKLWLLLLALLALTSLWGAVAASSIAGQASAADNVRAVSEPLSLESQQIYRSLSDADATEAAAFLSSGEEPFALRHEYQADIAQAARKLEAATAAAGQSVAGKQLAILSAGLPVYTGFIETARADNRLGLPLGAAYLREASGFMRGTLLPAARKVYALENSQLAAADQQATAVPYGAYVVALIAAIGLFLAQRWLARRTHRVINPGLLVATLAGLASLIWLVSAATVASVQLASARDHGSAPVEALAKADIAALQAHADESLTLIDRSGDDSFQSNFLSLQKQLGPGSQTLLTDAAATAAGSPGSALAVTATRAAPNWFEVHRTVRSLDDSGSYRAAVQLAVGRSPVQSGGLFSKLDGDLTGAMAADQASFGSAAQAGQGALAGLEAGVIVLSLIMAVGCVWGISRRLAEYR
jgi:hypothetical protein